MKVVYAVLLVLVGLLIGYLLWFPTWEIPLQFRYDVLKDTLTILLTVMAIAAAVLGIVVYKVLEREIGQRIMTESRRWITRLATSTGYSVWKQGFPDEAIRLTREAHDEYASGLTEKEPENQELIGTIRDNLAYYFSQTKQERTKQERDLARGYAVYIHNISHKFPKHWEIWEKTYREVFEAFPD